MNHPVKCLFYFSRLISGKNSPNAGYVFQETFFTKATQLLTDVFRIYLKSPRDNITSRPMLTAIDQIVSPRQALMDGAGR